MDGASTGVYNFEVRHPRCVGSITKNFYVQLICPLYAIPEKNLHYLIVTAT